MKPSVAAAHGFSIVAHRFSCSLACGLFLEVSEVKSFSRVQLFVTPWTVAYQAPPMRFSRQGYWSGLPFPSPGDLPDPGMEHTSPALADRFFVTELPGKPKGTFGLC